MTSQDPLHPQLAPGIEPELGALLGVFSLHNYLETLMDEVDVCNDVPHFERKIIVWLDHPKRLGALARDMNILPSTMTTHADQLETRGLVTRERDPNDRRAWLLQLTPPGLELRAEMVAKARELFRGTLNLTEAELHSFSKVSQKIHSNIQNITTC
ncbi:MarR family winged helix-turn-helix transcriptional regulator [Aliiroseovarius sp. 2305UL8-7]|uniref:MarR family winged helix-turn-helix transcriptional regulator n=1 Tax=Aliiroseovarius conchicola TaxID=3121637 RepID=UPI003528A959